MKEESFRKSKAKCPDTGLYQAFTINNKIKDELCVNGFIRRTWKLSDIDDHLYPPQYLIKIINRYYMNEWIHLIGSYDDTHSNISVFDILS